MEFSRLCPQAANLKFLLSSLMSLRAPLAASHTLRCPAGTPRPEHSGSNARLEVTHELAPSLPPYESAVVSLHRRACDHGT